MEFFTFFPQGLGPYIQNLILMAQNSKLRKMALI